MEKSRHNVDVENDDRYTEKGVAPVYADESGAVAAETFEYGDSTYARLQRFAGKFNIELRGIERVPEDERTDSNLMKVGTMVWLAICDPNTAGRH